MNYQYNGVNAVEDFYHWNKLGCVNQCHTAAELYKEKNNLCCVAFQVQNCESDDSGQMFDECQMKQFCYVTFISEK